MDEHARQEAFITALVTEHFALQSMASTTISESNSRASLYLLSLSSSLVARGFATQSSHRVFAPFAAAVLPTMFLLGWFGVVRLVDTSITYGLCLRRIAHIHHYYAGLVPEANEYFATSGGESQDAIAMAGIQSTRFALWFTMASMIGVVNAVLGGTMVALLLEGGLGVGRGVALVAAVAVAVACAVAVVLYERTRMGKAFPD